MIYQFFKHSLSIYLSSFICLRCINACTLSFSLSYVDNALPLIYTDTCLYTVIINRLIYSCFEPYWCYVADILLTRHKTLNTNKSMIRVPLFIPGAVRLPSRCCSGGAYTEQRPSTWSGCSVINGRSPNRLSLAHTIVHQKCPFLLVPLYYLFLLMLAL